MSPLHDRLEGDGFVPFFRSYTKTWVHTVATAGLTAFGTLTIVHRWFAGLALATYVLPPIVLYIRYGKRGEATRADDRDATRAVDRDAPPDEPSSETATEATSRPETTTEAAPRTKPEREPDAGPARERRPSESTPDERTHERHPTDDSGETPEPTTAAHEDVEGGADHRASVEDGTVADADDDDVTGDETADRDGAVDEIADRDGAVGEADGSDVDVGETDDSDETSDERRREREVESSSADWTTAESPADASLRDVVATSRGSYAVGDGGVVLGSGEDGEWSVLLEDGPAAGGNDLHGVDATSDGGAIWVAGASGSLGRLDPETGRHVDYTAPEDITDNWLGVAVGGSSGEETVLLITGSGAVLRGTYGDGEVAWTGPEKPGSGSSLSAITLSKDGVGYCCDTNDGVFETTDGGDSFDRIGLEGADGTLTDIATTDDGTCLASADDGVVHRFDETTWTPERVTDGTIEGLAAAGERVVACGDGTIYEREDPAAEWEEFDTDRENSLLAVSVADARGVAVGENGAVVERT
ncbi:hypothetical protein [Natronorubrum daqingense]|uniref:Photosynthesis system II assembly factor Ycf48/Hcf136-like domain-containing protein n=1 Tax=Natronorubrum daqingense TaxID=588898 RepID=A0A1N7ABF1_9EURY|nr:hypothetical protein [Natronorubrum daqingense]APX98045.1 hypothetical protein BB347_16280 [Natronorubrum daqingense]SIR36412.1 hypothetical protein SAMN05421809_1103 [Natronorubrum daqingense]